MPDMELRQVPLWSISRRPAVPSEWVGARRGKQMVREVGHQGRFLEGGERAQGMDYSDGRKRTRCRGSRVTDTVPIWGVCQKMRDAS